MPIVLRRRPSRSRGRAPRLVAGPVSLVLSLVLATLGWMPPGLSAQERAPFDAELLDGLRFRSIGPAVTGGRIHDIEALPDDPATLYVASASGGLWKSTNQGTTWRAIFDHQPVSTFGDVAIAPSDPDVVWAGTGEQQNRQSTSWGNGVYRSLDGGRTWNHLGLEETRHIARVRVHPDDPDVAWVAAPGNLWRPSTERGVFRTLDGGRSWEHVLAVDTLTGAIDLALDPSNPEVLYAATYQRLRRAWGFNGGGPGSGIWKSTDGGETWTRLTAGLPTGDLGRIGLALSPADPAVVYAMVEHASETGTYRSDDAGATWRRVNRLNPRPMYYSHIVADPADADRVYVLATEFYMSEDGGRTFREMPTRPTYDVGVHSDHHALWIDPGDTRHFYLAGDAGLHESFDRGETYRRINNIPIGQFYAIGLDDRDPFFIYGGMQDNHSWMGPSATRRFIGIINDDWSQTGFGDGMYQQPEPGNPRVVYVLAQNGGIHRVDPETGDRLDVSPAPPEGEEYRFDWVTPALVSRHDPATVYVGGNRLFISRDRGASWSHTEDLTKRIDRDTLELMGVRGSEPMLSKHDGTAFFGEITTIAESPLDPSILWVGTDDGNVQVSRDGGDTWTEVGRHLPRPSPTTYVSRVTASGAGPGVAYAALDAHRDGDFAPYLYRTDDFGRTWRSALADLPVAAGSVNEVVEHPRRPALLFLGTEHGLFASVDAGERWARLGADLPTTLYDDLAIHERDNALVAGTHGRSLWILDDLTPLEEWTADVGSAPAHLFTPKAGTIRHWWKSTSYRGQAAYAGENPPIGVLLHYHLSAPEDSARILVARPGGEVVRELAVPGEPGVIHRVVWDLRHPPPPTMAGSFGGAREGVVESERELPELPHSIEPHGPFVSPGRYEVTLVANGERATRPLLVRGDPALELSEADHRAREAFLVELLELQRRAFRAAARARERARGEGAPERARELAGRLSRIRARLYGLAGEFNTQGVTQGTLRPPTVTHREIRDRLAAELEEAERELEGGR